MKEKEIKKVPIEVIEKNSQLEAVGVRRLGKKALVGSSNLPYDVKVPSHRINDFQNGDKVKILPKVNNVENELAA